jgi:ClpP class serine protease
MKKVKKKEQLSLEQLQDVQTVRMWKGHRVYDGEEVYESHEQRRQVRATCTRSNVASAMIS